MVKYLLIFASCMNCSHENNTGDSNKKNNTGDSNKSKNKNNDPQSRKIINNIGEILNNHSSLKSIVENWCKQNNANLDEVLTFIKDYQLNIFEYFPNNSKYVKDNKFLFNIDEKIKDNKIQDKGLIEDLKYAFELMSKNIKKHGNKIDIYDAGTQKVIKESSNEVDIYCINANYRIYIRGYNKDQNERKKFDEEIKEIREEKAKYKLDENIVKILVGNTKYNMVAIDRTCGCELYYILYEIKLKLENYKSKNGQYYEKELNELVAIYNNNIGHFSQEVMKLKDGFVDKLTKDYAYSDEFKKIVNGSSDYGKNISKEDLKKAEDEFFSLDKKLSLDENFKKINYNFIHSYYRLYVRSDSSNQDKIRKFDEKVEELKKNNGLDENTVKILIGTTNRNMTAIDRTCGCELYYILNEINLNLKNYKSKNDQYNEKELNKIVAIYNNNIGHFSQEVMKLKDGFVDKLTKDYAYSDEFKKIVNGSSDYGKNISKEDLKKIEDEFFNFNSQKK